MDNYGGSLKLFDLNLNTLIDVYSHPDSFNLSHQDANFAQIQLIPGAQIDLQDLLKLDIPSDAFSNPPQSNSSASGLLTPIVTRAIGDPSDLPVLSVPSYPPVQQVQANPEPQVPPNPVRVQEIREPPVTVQPFGFQVDIEPGRLVTAPSFRASFSSNFLLIQLIRFVIFSN
jgi:hypothetical protein